MPGLIVAADKVPAVEVKEYVKGWLHGYTDAPDLGKDGDYAKGRRDGVDASAKHEEWKGQGRPPDVTRMRWAPEWLFVAPPPPLDVVVPPMPLRVAICALDMPFEPHLLKGAADMIDDMPMSQTLTEAVEALQPN